MQEGKIIKSVSGFYYVQSKNEIYPCKGRGVFRKKEITPLVGDNVLFDVDNKYIVEIKKRKNELKRPPIANIDQVLVVSSVKKPKFSSLLLDRFLVMIEAAKLKPIIFINKIDLLNEKQLQEFEEIKRVYEAIGYPVELISSKLDGTLPNIHHYFSKKITVIAGQTGVGKSSILNKIDPSLSIETDEISKRLGRGRHTTRYVELLEVSNGLIADTPGFSTVDFSNIETIDLTDCFPEMKERKQNCKFRGCLHNKEPNCAIKTSVQQEKISEKRYAHYLTFLDEIQSRKPRYS